MAGAASAHQAATASREQSSQQRAGRTRRTSADPQQAQQGATADAAAPTALNGLSRLQHLADASPQVAQLRRLQALADGRFAPVAQLAGGPGEEELVQGKFATAELQPQLQPTPRANNTGLPDQLKSGIESLSGLSMDHVRVHYNSSQPAQLNALAYAQGSDIHLEPGQERHLPHEAWHVVQQAQGRVRPTLQAKGVAINDDLRLEREADVMGAKTVQMCRDTKDEKLGSQPPKPSSSSPEFPSQGPQKAEPTPKSITSQPIQRAIYNLGDHWKSTHAKGEFKTEEGATYADIEAGGDGKKIATPPKDAPAKSYVPEYMREYKQFHPCESRRKSKDKSLDKRYFISYNKSGELVVPIKRKVNPFTGRAAFGGGMPAAPGGNAEVEDKTLADTARREILEEMGPFGFKLDKVDDRPTIHTQSHTQSYGKGKKKKKKLVNMTFSEATVRPAFGATPSEILSLSPEFHEMEGIASIAPHTLGVTKKNSKDEILEAVARACGIKLDEKSVKSKFEAWCTSATATAYHKSLLTRLPD